MYASVTDMEARFGASELLQLTDCLEEALTDDAFASVETALVDATASMNGYIRVRHALPLKETTPILKRAACDIARFYLYKDCVPEGVKSQYEEAIKLLKDISKGIIKLIDETGETPKQAEKVVLVGGSNRLFNQKTMGGF